MIEWPVIALASQKNYVSVYVCAVDNGEYIAEKYKKDLSSKAGSGNVSVGKSCIRIKNLEDVDLKVLKKVIQFAVKKPGLAK